MPPRAALLAALALSTASARVTVSLDYGWRTAVASNSSWCAFPTPTGPGVQCQGLGGAPDGDASSGACAAAACTRRAAMWQWGPRAGCWVGSPAPLNCSASGPDREAWVGAYTTSPNAPPPANAPEAAVAFDDRAWRVVDTPHDATIEGNYSSRANGGEAFLPAVVQWYRKHFNAPAAWAGQAVTLTLDASLSTSTFWLNGNQLVVARPSGYLPLSLRLDGAAGLVVGGANVFVAYVDGSETTGWWYEGSGLLRHSRLTVTPADLAVAPSGVSAPAYASSAVTPHGAAPAAGLTADAVVSPTVDVLAAADAAATFRLIAADGLTVVGTTNASGKGATTLVAPPMTIAGAELWSVARPYLYTLEVVLSNKAGSADAVNTSIGVRDIAFDAQRGMFVNQQAVKMRGFCEHESFAGVGGALPDRIDLFRLQQMRGVGGNAWRTSHNPPEPILLDLADRLGVLVLDENRVLASQENCVGLHCRNVPTYAGDPAADMGALALRDRNHASVFAYSLCNEAGCGDGSLLNNDTVVRAKQAAYDNDGSRLVGANMGWLSPVTPRTPMSDALDIMGMSHASGESVNAFHQREPSRPLMMSECCSCETQRGEDDDMPRNKSSVYYSNLNGGCLNNQVSTSDIPEFVAGTFVWTLHDYVGEPGAWPHVSSSFGAIDLGGFPKAGASWFRARWLSNISASDAGRPPVGGAATVHIVESWRAPAAGSTRSINVYTNAPLARLRVNGVTTAPSPVLSGGVVNFPAVAFAPGTLVAEALAADGATVVASHTRTSWGAPARLVLTIDAPSLTTGTGAALYLDGSDVALVRATVVDAAGVVCADAALPITFGVPSGPGRVWGVGNGDPANQEPNHAPTRSAYHGLARAIIRATLVATGSAADRALLAAVNADAGASAESSSVLAGDAPPPAAIVVTASAPGLPPATLSIALSVADADAPLAVAAASVGAADLTV